MSFENEKIVESKACQQCQISFDITDKDLEFYEKVSPVFSGKKYNIPTPKLCPDCRQQRRGAFFNYKNLYKNICEGCDQSIVARFHPESRKKVLCIECWAEIQDIQCLDGGEIDFGESIFYQYKYLVDTTYYQSLIGSLSNVENNSEFTNHTSEIIDSYFVFEANTIEESYYCFAIKNSKHVVDSSHCGNNQYLYESVDCYDMYESFYCNNSHASKFSYFLDNCQNCSYCIGCSGLINKQYYIFNKKVTPEEYTQLKEQLFDYSFIQKFGKKSRESHQKNIQNSHNILGSEGCSGNNIISSNNCKQSFDVLECSDCKYSHAINYSEDLYDVSSYGEKSNRMLDSISVGRYSRNILFSSIIGKGENLMYCIDVKKSKDCFLCVNLKNKQYCILNKQYTKEEYNILVPQIIEHMKQTGEWGEFFPSKMSPFGYNETVAQEYFPLERDDIFNPPNLPKIREGQSQIFSPGFEGEMSEGQRGLLSGGRFNWSDYEAPLPKVDKIISANKLPDNIADIPDDILNWAIECEVTKKPFRIIHQELAFYRKHNLPVPRKHPDQRHLERMQLRNPRKLYKRDCDKCDIEMDTTYAPEREERVYCEKCYRKEIY